MKAYTWTDMAKDLFTPSSKEFRELKKAVLKGTDAEFDAAVKKYGTELRCAVGCTVLHSAVCGASFSRVRKLVEAGADLNARNKHGTTALMMIITVDSSQRRKNVLSYLLKQGADPDIQNSCQTTALHMAAYSRDVFTRILLDAGADRNIKDIWGETPYDIAEGSNRYRMKDIFHAVPEQKPAHKKQQQPQNGQLRKNNPVLISQEHARRVKALGVKRGASSNRTNQ